MRKRRRRSMREKGVALLVVTVTVTVIGAAVGEFGYNSSLDLEAAANSRDMLRAEYLARSSMNLGLLLVGVQNSLSKQMQALNVPPEFRDLLVITDFANFLVKAFGGDEEARAGLGGLVGLDLGAAEGMGSGKGTQLELTILSEEGKYPLNCGGGLDVGSPAKVAARGAMFNLILSLIRPLRYDRMFNVADQDGVVITREDLPRNIIDWTDVDEQRYEPAGSATASEETYDKGRDRYRAHHHYMDTTEELTLVRGVSEDFWAAFGEMFTVYSAADCRMLTSAITPDSWPLVAAMIASSSPDRNAIFDPNTQLVAQQVAGIMKTGLPVLKNLAKTIKIEPCKVDLKMCEPQGAQGAGAQPAGPGQARPAGSGDTIELLSNLICSPHISQLPALAQGLTSIMGSAAPPPPQTSLRPIPMCPGRLAQYLREQGSGTQSPRRFFRLDATGVVQRNPKKSTQVHIRGVFDSQAFIDNPLCTNHPSCTRGGTFVYWRMD